MLGASQLTVDFRGMNFNTKKALCINFQKHASIFCEAKMSTINRGGHGRCYFLPTSVCATKNNDFSNRGQIQRPYIRTYACKYSKYISKVHQVATPTNKTTQTCWSVYLQTAGKQRILWFNLCFSSSIKRGYWSTYCNKISHIKLVYHWYDNNRWVQIEGVPLTPHLKGPVICTMVLWEWIQCHDLI